MNEKRYYVYGYIRLDTNTYFYIGKGKNKRYLNINKRSKHFKNILNKTECVVEILYDNLTEEEAFQLEVDTIYNLVFDEGYGIDIMGIENNDYYLVNATWGGEGASYKQSSETVNKRVVKNTGKKRTVEQRNRLGNSRKEYISNHPEELKRMQTLTTGRRLSEEEKQKISESRKGKSLSNEHKDKISKGLNNRSQEEKDIANEKRSKTQGTSIRCIELDLKFTSVHKAEKYCHDILGISFNHKTFKKYMSGDWKQDWYQEIEINGALTKLHWEYC